MRARGLNVVGAVVVLVALAIAVLGGQAGEGPAHGEGLEREAPAYWCKADYAELLIQALVAIGTFTVAIAAIWGERIRARILPVKLTVEGHNLRGHVVPLKDGGKSIYYHLKVVNKTYWRAATNCRVLLRQVSRRGPDNVFHPIAMPVPCQFMWSYPGFNPILAHIAREQVLDFGLIVENGRHFQPLLYCYSKDFEGFVKAGDALRFSLEVIADGFASPKYYVFEVAWDGKYSDNLDLMGKHLVIREIE